MKLALALAAHEWRTQLRSLRFRVLAGAYLLFLTAPVIVIFLLEEQSGQSIGPATYPAAVFLIHRFVSFLFIFLVSADALSRERDEGSFPILGIASFSNAGYLVRRWLAVLSIVLPLSLLPVIGAYLAAAAAIGAPVTIDPFVLPWLVEIVPIVFTASALALALGTITGGIVKAILLGIFAFNIFTGLLNSALERTGRQLEGPGDWIGPNRIFYAAQNFEILFYDMTQLTPASDAPYEIGLAISDLLPRALLLATLTAAGFSLATLFLRRTRRDIRPWPVRPYHPLRTYWASLNRLREEYALDPRVTWRDWLLMISGALCLAAGIAWLIARYDRFEHQADQRYAAEVSGEPRPTSPAIVPVQWKVRGTISRASEADLQVRGTVRNDGTVPESHAAFSLNPSIQIASIQSVPGSVRSSRAWDRLALKFDPPIAPGAVRQIDFILHGQAETLDFGWSERFADRLERHRKAAFAWDILDFSRDSVFPMVTRGRLYIPAADLVPSLRYTTWKLTPPAKVMSERGRFVPEESVFPLVDIEVSLELPNEFFVADSCGSVITADSRSRRLKSRCTLPLSDYSLVGGRLQTVATEPAVVAVLPGHVTQKATHTSAISSAMSLSSDAWPGMKMGERRVIMEWSPRSGSSPFQEMEINYWRNELRSIGKIILVPESNWVARRAINPEALAAEIISSELTRRRRVVPAESLFFRNFYRVVTMNRVGSIPAKAVIVKNRPPEVALLKAPDYSWAIWNKTLPALLTDIENRIGSRHFVESIGEFINSGKPVPGDAQELLGIMSRRSGVSLDRTYRDSFAGSAMPELTLDKIRSRRDGEGWIIEGALVNRGQGEAYCPVAVETDVDSQSQIVRVDTGGSTPFLFRSQQVPRIVLLDPRGICFRFAPIGTISSVRLGAGT